MKQKWRKPNDKKIEIDITKISIWILDEFTKNNGDKMSSTHERNDKLAIQRWPLI